MSTDIAHPIYFIRHGATPWNAESRYQGQTDTSLSAEGRDDARKNGKILLRMLNDDTEAQHKVRVVSSPLKRAHQSAHEIAKAVGYGDKIETLPPFQELSMGRWEGLTSAQVKGRYYEERKSRKTDRWHFRPQGGESMEQRCAEIQSALLILRPNTVLVTHSVVLKVIFHLLTGQPKEFAALETTPHVSVWCWNGAKMHRQGEN